MLGVDDDSPPDAPLREVQRIEWRGAACSEAPDYLVCEEPLEIRLATQPLVTLMRTPGHDIELTWGLLKTEGFVPDLAHIATVRHCTVVDDPRAEDNVITVTPKPEAELALDGMQRNLYASSSCGVCGKTTIEQVMARAPMVTAGFSVSTKMLYALPDRMRPEQSVFTRTGGLHAAGLFDAHGTPYVIREDVGRHNAVDKVMGWRHLNGGADAARLLLVSGRISYEIVHKALMAGMAVVAAVSAPSSLAVGLAREAGLTLVAFLRGERMCVYSAPERITAGD